MTADDVYSFEGFVRFNRTTTTNRLTRDGGAEEIVVHQVRLENEGGQAVTLSREEPFSLGPGDEVSVEVFLGKKGATQ